VLLPVILDVAVYAVGCAKIATPDPPAEPDGVAMCAPAPPPPPVFTLPATDWNAVPGGFSPPLQPPPPRPPGLGAMGL